jgi:hypothetical protein
MIDVVKTAKEMGYILLYVIISQFTSKKNS